MGPLFVLVPPPSVGAVIWRPVAERLTALGHAASVASLDDFADAAAPYWPVVVRSVQATLDTDRSRSVVLALHSNAGLFAPVLADALGPRLGAVVFVDAALPALGGASPVVPAELLTMLEGMAVDGRVPPWTQWWDDADVAPLFPDTATRATVEAGQPRLPLEWFRQHVPVPEGWDRVPCGYLFFGPPYDELADDARARGWLVERLPGLHLHQLVDPAAVAERLVAITRELVPGDAPP